MHCSGRGRDLERSAIIVSVPVTSCFDLIFVFVLFDLQNVVYKPTINYD